MKRLRRGPAAVIALALAGVGAAPWQPDAGDGTYRNPILFADYSDPDVVRAGDDYYLVASSFQSVPGLPILHSRDLVNWTIVGHAAERLPSPDFDEPRHGQGMWAPSIRHHDGFFWIYVGDPDRGIYLTRARDPRGRWEPLTLVQAARGWIDPSPLWDDDGSAYLVHAWAKSRAGFNARLTVHRLSPDGRRVLDEGRLVFDGGARHPTIEGPKLYKRNGWYYIFAPAGGVKTGWQTVLRSRSVFGPYEDRIVLDQGATGVNGPHQGAWIDDAAGGDWFAHFQDRGAHGRVVHLQPMSWRDDWPVIGEDRDGDGRGEPVAAWAKPRVNAAPHVVTPPTGDEFDTDRLGLQWQWQANPGADWWSRTAKPGALRLSAVPDARPANLWPVAHLLLQKFPAPAFVATTRVDAGGLRVGEKAGLVVMGLDYAALVVERTRDGLIVRRSTARDADTGSVEGAGPPFAVPDRPMHLRVSVEPESVCRFGVSGDGRSFEPVGGPFVARPGRWVGAKVGLFASGSGTAGARGHADFEWFHVRPPGPVRIALVGDSTVTDDGGWGRGFKARVEEGAVVVNLAANGRSSKSYAAEGRWLQALRQQPDYVLIQFGHNDQPGKGDARETDLPTYARNLERFVDEARAADATPVIVTSLTRRRFTAGGRIESDLAGYVEAARRVARERRVPLVDLHAKSIERLEEVGAEHASNLGPRKADATPDRTHLNQAGSAMFGAIVAEELHAAVPALAPFLRVDKPWSERMASSVMVRTPDPMLLDAINGPRWEYTPGLVLKAVFEVWERTGDERYWKYAEAYYDGMIDEQGEIRGYRADEYNIDRINAGKPLFLLHRKTGREKYRKAIERLRRQLRDHPRTSEGGFWHKKRYPHQMWLDGLYMGAPFLAEYASVFGEPAAFDDAVKQFVLMEKHARDARTGLLYHGWDESRQQKWADPKTGRSASFWGRAMGWYAMGLVDTLDFLPAGHPGRGQLVGILRRLADAALRVQDARRGVWYQVVDQGGREGNYREASVSAMFAYALLKGSRLGYLDARHAAAGERAYAGMLEEFIEVDADGAVNIHHVCQVAGLGGDPEKERYRDGTYEYYVTEKIRSNDPKAVGPFILASLEKERRRR